VLYLDHCADLSGGEIALVRLLMALDEVDAHVILAEDGPLVGMLRDRGITVEVVRLDEGTRSTNRLSVRPGLHEVALAARVSAHAFRLRSRIRDIKPDVIHTNSLKSAVYGSIAARVTGVPVVCHLRDRLATDYMSGSAARMMRVILRALPQAVIANSRATMATLTPSTSAVRIWGAVAYDPAPQQFTSERPRLHPEFTVGMVGRLAAWKGQEVFLEAFALAFPERDARAVIVGSAMFDEGDYTALIERRIDELELRGCVEMAGFQADVNRYLEQFDALVHASIVPEPFGQVIVEGMAAGLAVVATDAGGPSEIITPGLNGLLYPPGDVHALAEALAELRRSPEKRTALGNAARLKSREFHPDRVAEQVMAVYRVLAGAI
jgi:glycosyltransferase involved in cell wall biosynthesis